MISQKDPKKNTSLLKKTKNNKVSFLSGDSQKINERATNDRAFQNNNYLLYLSSSLQKTPWYHLWHQYLSIFRKFKLISLLFRLYSYLLVLLQLGTAFFVIILGVLMLFPILLLGAGVVIFSYLLLYRRENNNMEPVLKHKNTVIFFPTRGGELADESFFRAHITELSARPNTTILIVSPHFWSGQGITGNRFYFLIRKETENVYILRKHYYFSLKKVVFSQKLCSLTLVY